VLGNAQPTDRELVDFESPNSGVSDHKPADGHGANRQRADCERAKEK